MTLFGHLDPEWRQPLQRAVDVLEADRLRQHQEAGEEIAALIYSGLTATVEQSLPEGAPEAPVRKLLFNRYQRQLIKRERDCRTRVEELFYYHDLDKSEQGIDFAEEDLFHQESWYLWGLNRCDAVVVQNGAQRGLLERNFGKQGTLIYNGYDSTSGPARPAGTDVLWVANFRTPKRPRRLNMAC